MRTNSASPPERGHSDDSLEGRLDLWGRSATPDALAFHPSAAWLFLRRNLTRICVTGALAAAAAFGALQLAPLRYSATAVLMVDPRVAKVTRIDGVIPNLGGDAVAIESVVQAARSEGFLGELADELDLPGSNSWGRSDPDPLKARIAAINQLTNRLSIARRGATYVIDVTATTTSAEESATVANAAAAKLIRDQEGLRTGASAATATEIENRLNALRGRVSRAEEAAAQLKARLNVTDAGADNTLLERRVAELNQQLVLASARTAEARAHYDLLKKAGATATDRLPQSIQSSTLGALRAEYARLSRQSADQSTVLGPRHPEVVGLNAQIAEVKRQIAKEIGRMMATSHSEFLEAEEREADLSHQLKAAETESGELGPQMVKLQELDREAKAERAVYEELLNRQRELLQVKDLEPSDIRIVSRAAPPARPSPGPTLLAGGSALFGLLTGLCYAAARERNRGTLNASWQTESLGAVEALGFLPSLKKTDRAQAPDLARWLSDIYLDIESARSAEGQIILITSTARGDGRSTVARNLAAHLASVGERVLLIEADRAARSEEPPFGLLDVLDAPANLALALTKPPRQEYALLPYGGRTLKDKRVAATLMGRGMLSRALGFLQKKFDTIIVDGPTALEGRHVRTLADQADTTFFLVAWDKTKIADAQWALERLAPKRKVVLFNKVDVKRLRFHDPEQSRRLERISLADA